MFFETAGIEVSPWIPPCVAFTISFFTSMAGVSGAFLLLPFQMSFLGFTNPSVSSTNQLYNIVAIPSGVYRYIKEGRMVWPLTWVVVIGTLPGVVMGAFVRVAYLPDPKSFKLFAACVLLYIGIKMLRDLLGKKAPGQDKSSSEKHFQELIRQYRKNPDRGLDQNMGRAAYSSTPLTGNHLNLHSVLSRVSVWNQSGRGFGQPPSGNPGETAELPAVHVTKCTWKQIGYEFYGEHFEFPVWGILSLSFIVGIIGGIYGIGGGAIIAPFFVSFFKLPIYTVAGAALMGTFITSVAGVIFYQAIAPFYPDMAVAPDWLLGTLFGLGGMGGMYLGARCQKYIPARALKWMLSVVILFTAIKYAAAFF